MPASATAASKAAILNALPFTPGSAAENDKLVQDNSELKRKVAEYEEKIRVMTENYAESQAENSQMVKNLQD